MRQRQLRLAQGKCRPISPHPPPRRSKALALLRSGASRHVQHRTLNDQVHRDIKFVARLALGTRVSHPPVLGAVLARFLIMNGGRSFAILKSTNLFQIRLLSLKLRWQKVQVDAMKVLMANTSQTFKDRGSEIFACPDRHLIRLLNRVHIGS